MIGQVSFTGLPPHLWGRTVNGLTPRELTVIINDAVKTAKIKNFETTAKEVLINNRVAFGPGKVISDRGAQMLLQEYGAKTARQLRDALAKTYRGFNGDGILDMII